MGFKIVPPDLPSVYCDTQQDLQAVDAGTLPIGTAALVLSGGKIFILSPQRAWEEV